MSGSQKASWVTLAEAAAVTGVSSNAIRRAAKSGTIRSQRAGDSQDAPWLVQVEDVEAKWGDEAPAPEAEADEVAVVPATVDKREQGRLSKLRERLVISEPKRRWWHPKR